MGRLNKQQLRKWAKNKRAELDMESLSSILAEKLQQTEEYKNAKKIMIFHPLKDEVNILSLLEDETKTFYLPKISGENLLCCKYNKGAPLCESCFHTKEPLFEVLCIPDLVIVPALAVDINNYRLGYGGGFYDRYLAQFAQNSLKTVVCIPKMLVVDTIYPNEHDIKIDKIITA